MGNARYYQVPEIARYYNVTRRTSLFAPLIRRAARQRLSCVFTGLAEAAPRFYETLSREIPIGL